jgi:DNA ligase-1
MTATLAQFNRVVSEAAATSSKIDKQNIIRLALHQEPDLGRLFNLALSPYVTFGIAKLPIAPSSHRLAANDDPEARAMMTLDEMSRRELTGDTAKNMVGRVINSLDTESAEGFTRILLKDLRAGFSESTVNKAKPGTVPVFSCQLAPSELAVVKDLTYPIIAEPKWDGVRTIAIKRAGAVTLFSRNGLPFENFAEVQDFLASHMCDNSVFDGELISSQGFHRVMKRAQADRGKNVDVPISYVIFDAMTLKEWDALASVHNLHIRKAVLAVAFDVLPRFQGLVRMGDYATCDTVEEVAAFYQLCLEHGLEGIMLKAPGSRYTFKRNAQWQKLKPFDTADLRMTGVYEGEGALTGTLGGINLVGEHDGKKIVTNCGSGFSRILRDEIWANPQDYIGQAVEVKFQEITLAQDATDYSMRFVTYVRVRGIVKI